MSNYISIGTGNWNDPTKWTSDSDVHYPGYASSDTAIIQTNHIITITNTLPNPLGSKIGAIGVGVAISGTVIVNSGAILTLQGYDLSTNAAMQINRYGLFSPQPGSTIQLDLASYNQTCILNQGRFEAIGTSGLHITFTSPTGNFNWGSGGDTNTKTTNEVDVWGPYDVTTNPKIVVASFGNSNLSNAAKTGLASVSDSSLIINSSAYTLSTPKGTLEGIASTGDYYIDYDMGLIYAGVNTLTGGNINITYWSLDKVLNDWKGWGIVSIGAYTDCTCLLDYCDFSYMGSSDRGPQMSFGNAGAPINLSGFTGSNAHIKNCIFNLCIRYVLLNNCVATAEIPLLIQNNIFNNADGGQFYDAICPYSSTCSYITIDSNTINHRGKLLDLTNISADCQNIRVTNNIGCVGFSLVYNSAAGGAVTPFANQNQIDGLKPGSPDLYIGSNIIKSVNETGIDTRFLCCGGTSGHPAIIENNWFHHLHRIGHLNGSYIIFRSNRFGISGHHGITGPGMDDAYSTDIFIYNNLFYNLNDALYGPSAAISLSYNHRTVLNNINVTNNTCHGWYFGLLDFGDRFDQDSYALTTNISCVNNIITSGGYALVTYSGGTSHAVANTHVLECDYNDIYGQTEAYSIGFTNNTNSCGYYQGNNKYNRLNSGSRNIPGIALFDSNYTTNQTGQNLVYTVNTIGQNHTLSWGGGTPIQLIYDYGTSSGQGLRTLGCTGKSGWITNSESIRLNWLWIISGTGAGQTRAITHVTTNTVISATVHTGGSGWSVNDYVSVLGGTTDAATATELEAPYYAILKITSVVDGAASNISVISGGCYSVTPSSSDATTFRLTGTTGGGLTVDLTFAPGLLLVPDLITTIDSTSIFAIVKSVVQLSDTATGTVHVGLCPVNPAESLYTSSTVWPTTTQTDTNISINVNNTKTTNPGYTPISFGDSTAINYKWPQGSPCQNAGTSDNAPSNDYFGTSRPQGSLYDIGFYEYPIISTQVNIPILIGNAPNSIGQSFINYYSPLIRAN